MQIHLVHVMVPGFADDPVEGIPDVVGDERKEEQQVLSHMVSALKEKLSIDATAEILDGETAEVIAQACKHYDADEVIVPSHARHGFSRIWFGSMADEIVDAAPCTVIVLKMPQAKV
jgi:nucleotide-binding universal stress UspA family protein